MTKRKNNVRHFPAQDPARKVAVAILELLESKYLPPYGRAEVNAVTKLLYSFSEGKQASKL